MARKRTNDQPIGVGLTAKQMKRKKPINADLMRDIEPLTENQKLLYKAYESNQNIVAYGAAGTGKTFITLYNALCDVLDERSPYEKIYIVRSLVATREIGFLPGDHEDKSSLYQIPYKNMVKNPKLSQAISDVSWGEITRRDFPELFQHWGAEPFGKAAYPKVNVISHDESVTIEAELAGYKKDEIDIEVKEGVLTISGMPIDLA